ncbi:uncharacterized protein LOC144551317 isoform X2 [Carex rostrata]
MKKARGGGEVTGLVTVSKTSPGSSFRELDHVFLQTQARIWLGEVLHVRFDDETSMADLIADGELLFQVSKLIWKMLVKRSTDLKYSKFHIYERTSSGKSEGKYTPYPKVDSFLKICQIMGLTGIDLFSPSDVVERRDTRRVCMCIRSLSIKARSKNLDVPDFDVVTYTIAMPNYVVGGICRSFLEQSRSSSSRSTISSRGSYRQRSFSGNSEQSQEPQYDSDEAESCLTEVECDTPISSAELDQSPSFDLDGEELLEESVDDKRFSLSWEEQCSENCLENSINSPGFSASYMDKSNSSMPSQNESSELSPEVVSGVNHVPLSRDSWLSFGQDNDLTPESKLSASENFQENTMEDSCTRISDGESSCACTVAAELDDEFELEKNEDNFTQELSSNLDESFSDCTEESRLLREGGVPELNSEFFSSHFEEQIDGSKFMLSQSLTTTELIYESTLDSIGHVDPSSEEISTSREIEAGDEFECEKVIKHSEDSAMAPVEGCEKERKQEVRHTGHKVITSVAGGITLVGVLLIFLQLRRSHERNHVVMLPSKINKAKEEAAKRNVEIQKPNTVYPGEWLKI